VRGVPEVRLAIPDDAPLFGRLMFDFNTEFDEPVPPAEVCAERMRPLVEGGDTAIVLGGEPGEEPCGMAVLRFRPALYEDGAEAYLAELYVAPANRGRGIGRAVLEVALATARDRGAVGIDLNTDFEDTEAHALYKSAGFRHTALFYEREL
jgi:ribosomal protein S18 acetylase RimI-like enzyme